jgi:AmmeMemoRadiSam system protein B
MWHRSAVVAGSFYPTNPARLSADIEHYLEAADLIDLSGEPIALISPHAGYIYSGPVAAYSYRQLAGKHIDLAIVIAPSHRARFNGASIIPSGTYETPLGGVNIDGQMGALLEQEDGFSFIKEAHQAEHSLEVQVPFLQKVLGSFSLVPIIVGTVEIDTCRMLARSLAKNLEREGRKWIIILSTDLSHYFPYGKACEIDRVFIKTLLDFDENELYAVLSRNTAQACGEGPVLTGMITAKMLGASAVKLLKYANSGDTAGGKDQVVGYLSAAIVK